MIERNERLDLDYRRAVVILRNRIKNVSDLQAIWKFYGHYIEKYHSIEKISRDKK